MGPREWSGILIFTVECLQSLSMQGFIKYNEYKNAPLRLGRSHSTHIFGFLVHIKIYLVLFVYGVK